MKGTVFPDVWLAGIGCLSRIWCVCVWSKVLYFLWFQHDKHFLRKMLTHVSPDIYSNINADLSLSLYIYMNIHIYIYTHTYAHTCIFWHVLTFVLILMLFVVHESWVCFSHKNHWCMLYGCYIQWQSTSWPPATYRPLKGQPRHRASGKLEGSDGSAEEDEMGMDAVQLTEKRKIACMLFRCGRWFHAGLTGQLVFLKDLPRKAWWVIQCKR